MPRIEPVPFEDLPDEVREHIEMGVRRGTSTGDNMRIFATSPYVARDMISIVRRNFQQGRIGGRLEELLRLRSAQLNGCAPCAAARKDPRVTDDDVACLVDPKHLGLPRRETLALQLLETLSTDHHAVGDETVLELHEVFDTEEIVELLYRTSVLIANHRFVHLLDALGDSAPLLGYDAEAVRAAWEREAVGTRATATIAG